eukprot:589168-Pelagomonas_calceolata.AAC.1
MGNFFTPLTQPAAFSQANSEMSISKGNTRPMPAMRGPGSCACVCMQVESHRFAHAGGAVHAVAC